MATWSIRPRSLRGRFGLRIATGTAVVLLATGVAVDRSLEARLIAESDRALLARARALATLTELEAGVGYNLEFADEVMPEFSRSVAPDYFEVWVESGRVLERSRSLGGADLPREPHIKGGRRFADVRLPDGRSGRLVQLDFVPQVESREGSFEGSHAPEDGVPGEARTATVIVATARAPIESALAQVRRATAAGLGALGLLLAAIGSWAVARGVEPLAAIGRQVAELRPDAPGLRLSLAATPSEALPLVEKLNDLLQRVELVLERERRLSRDLAHELRTPVAELRTLAEVGARWPEDPEGLRRFAEDARQIALAMDRIVVTLLSLARAEAGLGRAERGAVELGAIVEAASRRVRVEALEREITVALDLPAELSIASDPVRVELVLGNLVENAVLHAPPGATVAVRARLGEGGIAWVEIANPAPDLTPEDLPHLFERFWRKDPARRPGNHVGLGLTLAAALARSLGGQIAPRLEPGGRLVMRVELPAGL